MNKEMVISSTPHETRVAILEDDQVVEIFIEREHSRGVVGNIYKGRVSKVLPGMQSAFVDLGLERDAFLYVTDVISPTEEALEDEEEHRPCRRGSRSRRDRERIDRGRRPGGACGDGGDRRGHGCGGAKSGFNQPGGIEAVESAERWIIVRQMAGQSAQIPLGGQSPAARKLRRHDRHAPDGWFVFKQLCNDLLTFFGLQRAGAIDQRPAGFKQCDRLLQQPLLQRGQRADIGFLPQPGHVGMAADGAGRGAGRIDQDAVGASPSPCHSAASVSRFRLQRQPRQIFAQPRHAGRRAVDRGDARAGLRQLRGLAAGRGAEIGDGLPSMSPNRRAGSAAAASCTHHCPSEKPGSIVTEPCSKVRTVPVAASRRAGGSPIARHRI